ncbi:hypothetical protein ILUMI_12475 [Ignelater luminosus]|uniref:Uncharacterized protein n=1 Tax=Ignelater luminosus TaxID=2038154 RepID=A0A8K0CYH9_IGNLU|nr:hypothetical protein ILUMI_12475 [Ignelater luminosus]
MSKWLRFIIFLLVLGLGKAHHMIRVVILAAMGLAGLWMLHTLAQDFNKIYNNVQQHQQHPASDISKFLAKRSISNSSSYSLTHLNETSEHSQIDWERILTRDPVGCARSFVCQLAATNPKDILSEESIILYLIQSSSQKETWASKQLRKALKYGQQATTPVQCRNRYRYCPYSSRTMISLLRFFGET